MRFAVFGAGGLGAYYGARLVEAGYEVSFIARGSHLEAMQKNGLKVISPVGDVYLEKPGAPTVRELEEMRDINNPDRSGEGG